MAKDTLETRVKKSVLKIEKSVSGVYNILTDFTLKFCHIIERMGDRYLGRDSNLYYPGS
jgi:hypothetical protein